MDYGSGPYTVTFPAGVTSVPFNVSINDDMIFEGNENFTLTINSSSLPTGGTVIVGSPDQATVTIVDNDRKPFLIYSHAVSNHVYFSLLVSLLPDNSNL